MSSLSQFLVNPASLTPQYIVQASQKQQPSRGQFESSFSNTLGIDFSELQSNNYAPTSASAAYLASRKQQAAHSRVAAAVAADIPTYHAPSSSSASSFPPVAGGLTLPSNDEIRRGTSGAKASIFDSIVRSNVNKASSLVAASEKIGKAADDGGVKLSSRTKLSARHDTKKANKRLAKQAKRGSTYKDKMEVREGKEKAAVRIGGYKARLLGKKK